MRTRYVVAIGLSAALASTSILADNHGYTGTLGLMAGQAEQAISESGVESEKRDGAFGLRASLNITPNLALEAAYLDGGETKDKPGDTLFVSKADMGMLGIKLTGPISRFTSLYARTGVAFWKTDLALDGPQGLFEEDDKGRDLYAGVGLEFWVSSRVALGLEYTYSKLNAKYQGVEIPTRLTHIGATAAVAF